MIDDSGAAFPSVVVGGSGSWATGHAGMSLRAWLAGQAMVGLLELSGRDAQNIALGRVCLESGKSYAVVVAERACVMADALLAELRRGGG